MEKNASVSTAAKFPNNLAKCFMLINYFQEVNANENFTGTLQ